MSDLKAGYKCTKYDIRWGSTPDTAKEVYSALPDPLP